jgi:hypothetical protein
METLTTYIDPMWLYAAALALIAVVALVVWVLVVKNRRRPGEFVFRASRWSKNNRLLPAQVIITADSITLYRPQWIGKIEESIHIAHVSSIKIDTNLIFSNIFVETTGGHNPIVYSGHTKGDAVKIKALVERHQSERYAQRTDPAQRPAIGGRNVP